MSAATPPASRTTMRDVAAAAGVSLETVSRVLNGKYKSRDARSRDRVAAVRGIADRLGYRPDPIAVAMRTGRTRQVAIVVHRDSIACHSVLLEFLAGINEGLERAGRATVLARLLEPTASAALADRVAGGIDAAVVVDGVPPAVERALAARVPLIARVNADPWEARLCARRDERHAGRTAGEELARLGYRRAVLVRKQPYAHFSADQREHGFLAAFAGDRRSVIVERAELPLGDRALARMGAAAHPNTVIVALDPLTALALIDACARLGLRPGVDVGIAALDEQGGMEYSTPGLARMSHDRAAIGAAAAAMIIAALDGGDEPALASRELRGTWRPGTSATPR